MAGNLAAGDIEEEIHELIGHKQNLLDSFQVMY